MNLSDLRSRLRAALMDVSALVWDDASLDEAIRQALADYNLFHLEARSAVLQMDSAGTGIDLSILSGFADLMAVTYPWEGILSMGANPGRVWRMYWEDGVPRAELGAGWAMRPDDPVRVYYLGANTLAGLDGAAVTTVQTRHQPLLVKGAAGHAARARALDRGEGFNNDPRAAAFLRGWGEGTLNEFEARLRQSITRPWLAARWELD